MMSLISQWWSLLLLISIICFGLLAFLAPHKVMTFLGKMMNPTSMRDEHLDNMPTIPGSEIWLFGGRTWSEYVKTMEESPEELRYRVIWIRAIGFMFLFMVLVALCFLVFAINSGAL